MNNALKPLLPVSLVDGCQFLVSLWPFIMSEDEVSYLDQAVTSTFS